MPGHGPATDGLADGQNGAMTAKPVRAMTFEELRAEVVARPLDEDAQHSGDERLEEVRQEIARRDGAPVPLASAGLDDAPADPEQPSNPA